MGRISYPAWGSLFFLIGVRLLSYVGTKKVEVWQRKGIFSREPQAIRDRRGRLGLAAVWCFGLPWTVQPIKRPRKGPLQALKLARAEQLAGSVRS